LLSETVRYDVVDAVIASGFDDISAIVPKGEALMKAVLAAEEFKTTLESFNRVGNLASKASNASVHPELFVEDGERQLFDAWNQTNETYRDALSKHNASEALAIASAWKGAITLFFDSVMVMAEDDAVRANRLALLAAIDQDLKGFADFSKLVG
jgi:glycyl-tRNA synthetase beta chain